jgi:hypothetical protein
MSGRKKRLPDDAKVMSFALAKQVRHLLHVIELEREDQGETASEIVSEAIVHYFDCVVKLSKEDHDDLAFKRTEKVIPESKSKVFQLRMPKKDVG